MLSKRELSHETRRKFRCKMLKNSFQFTPLFHHPRSQPDGMAQLKACFNVTGFGKYVKSEFFLSLAKTISLLKKGKKKYVQGLLTSDDPRGDGENKTRP